MSHSPATPSEWEPTEPLPSDEAPQAGTPTPQERTVAFDPHADATAVFDPTQDETAVLPPMGGDTAALEAGPEPTRVIDPGSADTFAAPDGGASVVTDPAEREPDVAPARTRRTPLIIAAAVLAAILLIAGIAWAVSAITASNRERAITGTATTYLQSIAAADAQAALATLAERPANEVLLTGEVLRVSQDNAPLTDIVVSSPVLTGDTSASVTASYKIGGQDVSTTLFLVGDGRTSWLLADGTADLTLSAPTGLTVNAAPVTESTNPVFPGSYTVGTHASPTVIAEGDTTAVLTAPDSEPAALTVAAALSSEGRQTVLDTVKGRLDECLAATESRPADCPFGVATDNVEVAPGSVRFALVNDPWAGFSPALDPATLQVTGRIHLSVDATATVTQNGLSTDATQRLEADRGYTVDLRQQPLAVVWS